MTPQERRHQSVPSHVIGETTELPKPLRRLPELPDPAQIRALRSAARKSLGMTDRAAGAMSTIWVRPEALMPQVEQPRRIRIPGGDLLYIEGLAWVPRLMADPFNPRNAGEYLYPLSGASASSTEQEIASSVTSQRAELTMTAPSRDALLNALSNGMAKTRATNALYPPIGDQGIMDAPFGVMTVFSFDDASPDIAVPEVREGTSRVSHAHAELGLEPEDTVLRMPSGARAMTDFINEINSLVEKPVSELTENDKARVRCATANFILIVGFEADEPGSLDLAEALKTKVAQEHLNTKRDWSETAQNAVMADDCLEAAFGAALLSSGEEYAWLRGLTTAETAAEAGVSRDADDRSTRLLWLFTTEEPAVHNAIRRPIAFVLRKDNARKQVQVRKTTKVPYAVELIAREFRGRTGYPDSTVERMIKVLENGAKVTGTSPWTMTTRTLKLLKSAALTELQSSGKPGKSCTELAVRALYYAAIHDVLRVPRNDQGERSDRRSVADVLDSMVRTPRGIELLAFIVQDGRRGLRPVLRDEAGDPVDGADGQPVPLKNEKLRYDLFPKGQKGSEPKGQDPYLAAQIRLREAVEALAVAVDDVAEVQDDDGNSLVEQQGLLAEAKAWRKQLNNIAEQLSEWYDVGVEYRASNAEPPASPASPPEGGEAEAA
ncbi:hypothetical protein [Jidongwangia harbinensis]|uniref:hypothetical protein n=1 Tax=Jidongwangia harbinensis TaxID=2878561 RepID=UPI001CD98468|nr:hypothetical protein [Jidongwangia harbinensis]MCA2215829.1 hypothetical protein [Jidongwangia harbinensis]